VLPALSVPHAAESADGRVKIEGRANRYVIERMLNAHSWQQQLRMSYPELAGGSIAAQASCPEWL
jgi:hypothetical protein